MAERTDMGNKEELANYKFQLGQVQEAIDKESTPELEKLKKDLQELITLYTTLCEQEAPKKKPVVAAVSAPPILKQQPTKKEEYIYTEKPKTVESTELVCWTLH